MATIATIAPALSQARAEVLWGNLTYDERYSEVRAQLPDAEIVRNGHLNSDGLYPALKMRVQVAGQTLPALFYFNLDRLEEVDIGSLDGWGGEAAGLQDGLLAKYGPADQISAAEDVTLYEWYWKYDRPRIRFMTGSRGALLIYSGYKAANTNGL